MRRSRLHRPKSEVMEALVTLIGHESRKRAANRAWKLTNGAIDDLDEQVLTRLEKGESEEIRSLNNDQQLLLVFVLMLGACDVANFRTPLTPAAIVESGGVLLEGLLGMLTMRGTIEELELRARGIDSLPDFSVVLKWMLAEYVKAYRLRYGVEED